jgi:hypothetical protein
MTRVRVPPTHEDPESSDEGTGSLVSDGDDEPESGEIKEVPPELSGDETSSSSSEEMEPDSDDDVPTAPELLECNPRLRAMFHRQWISFLGNLPKNVTKLDQTRAIDAFYEMYCEHVYLPNRKAFTEYLEKGVLSSR